MSDEDIIIVAGGTPDPPEAAPTASPHASGPVEQAGFREGLAPTVFHPTPVDVNEASGRKHPLQSETTLAGGYVKTPKPEGFDTREFCDAQLDDGSTCKRPRDECTEHCGAWARQKGRACPAYPVSGRKRCRMHGGGTLVGPASGTFKTGKHSSLRPKHLRREFDAAMQDKELLASRQRVAYWRATAVDLIRNFEDVVGGDFMTRLREEWVAMEAARDAKPVDHAKIASQLDLIGKMIKQGASAMERQDEIERALDNEAKHSRDEIKRLVSLNQMIEMRQALTIVHQIIDLVTQHVKDKEIRQAIYKGYLSVVPLSEGFDDDEEKESA